MIITGNRNFRDLLEHRNESSPENIFLIWEKAGVNYRELNRQTNQLSNLFLAMGVGKGDRVMIHLSNCPEFIYSLFALLKIGAVAVLSNINNVYDDLCYTLSHSESYLVISELEYYKLIREAQLKTPLLKKILLADNREMESGAGMPITPNGPFVKLSHRSIITDTIIATAIVHIAKYGPLILNMGQAIMALTAVVKPTDSGNAIQKEIPVLVVSKPLA